MTASLFKLVHLLGAIVFLGNIIVTAWWKIAADRTRNPKIIAFAQRQVAMTDWVFTLPGVIILVIGGMGASVKLQLPSSTGWVVAGQVLLIASGVVWLGGLVPLQRHLSKLTSSHAQAAEMPEAYWRAQRWWIGLGILATILPLAALYLMVAKPI